MTRRQRCWAGRSVRDWARGGRPRPAGHPCAPMPHTMSSTSRKADGPRRSPRRSTSRGSPNGPRDRDGLATSLDPPLRRRILGPHDVGCTPLDPRARSAYSDRCASWSSGRAATSADGSSRCCCSEATRSRWRAANRPGCPSDSRAHARSAPTSSTPRAWRRRSQGIDVAYYLAHSMAAGEAGFAERDLRAARDFATAAAAAGVGRIIYLGGLGDDATDLSHHLASRHAVGAELAAHGVPVTEFRARSSSVRAARRSRCCASSRSDCR